MKTALMFSLALLLSLPNSSLADDRLQAIHAFRGMNILTPTVIGDSIFTSAYGGKSLLFQMKKEGESVATAEAWTNMAAGYMSTPVVMAGHIYLHLQNQRFTRIELATGIVASILADQYALRRGNVGDKL